MLTNRNVKCVINTDLDGFLSGLLLHHFLDWEIVGFCNSRDTMWLDQSKVTDLREIVFVDMFVSHSEIKSIDQHIVATDYEHCQSLSQNKNKLNPNIIRNRVFFGSSYYRKYPFGTFHFLVSELERQGIDVKGSTYLKEKQEKTKTSNKLRMIDLMLRVDDTLNTTVRAYKDNASDWWSWLLGNSGGSGDLTQTFITYCKAIESGEIPYNVPMMKREIGDYLRKAYGCDTDDGGYRSARAFGEEQIRVKAKRYLRDLAKWCGWREIVLAERYTLYIGDRCVDELKVKDFGVFSEKSVYKGEQVFSYAFISAYENDNNFSYTGNMRKC